MYLLTVHFFIESKAHFNFSIINFKTRTSHPSAMARGFWGGGGDLSLFSQGGGRETFQEIFCHTLGLAKIGQKISGQNVTAFGINIYSWLKFHTVPKSRFFFLYMFLSNQRFISHNLLLCRPSQRSARSQVPSQVATHQMIGSQLWAGETPDSNPGLEDNSQARYH
jgi:hypothetical protein